ncbi:hypothetical protein Tco_1105346 [Tanacetum coccineum]
MLKSRFMDSGEGDGKKKQSNVNVTISSCSDSSFPSLCDVAVDEGTAIPTGHVPSGTPNATSVLGNVSNPNEGDHESVMKEIPAFYANKLSPTSLTKANLRMLYAYVLNDADYDVWLPLVWVHKVDDRMKNSLYCYFISKMLAFPVVEWFVLNNWKKY